MILQEKLNKMKSYEEVDTFINSGEYEYLTEDDKRKVITRLSEFVRHDKTLPLEEFLVEVARQERVNCEENN